MKKCFGRMKNLFAFIFCLVIFTSGCSKNEDSNAMKEQTEEQEKSVSMILSFKSPNLDPHTNFTPIRAGVTETLLKLDQNQKIEGWLAEKFESDDYIDWELTLREGIKFHDGTNLDAEAVKASLERSIRVNQSLGGSLNIKSMKAEGQILKITTNKPYPALLSELVNPYTSIVNVKAEKKMGEAAFTNAPVGTGPFKVNTFKANQEVRVVRNESYWAGKPKISTAVIKFIEDANVRAMALQSKEADVVYNLPAEGIQPIKQDNELSIESVSGLRAHFFLFNQESMKVNNVKVRQALDLLVDRNSIAKDIMLGHAVPANGPFNSSLPFGSDNEVKQLEIEKAKKLLKEAGYQENSEGKLEKEGKIFKLELITYKARPELPLIAQLFQSDAAKAGIEVQIKNVENADTHLSENKDWDLATYSNNTSPRGDGSYFLNTAFTKTGALNVGKINIPELDEVISKLNETGDQDSRIQLTKQAVDIINKEAVHSYTVYPNMIIGMNKRIKNWKPTAEEYYILTHTMDVK